MNIAIDTHAAGRPAEPYGTRLAPDTVRLERLLPGPVERVWSYLIDSDKRARWLASGPIEARVGGMVQLTWRNAELSDEPGAPGGAETARGVDHAMTGTVTQCDPPRLLAFNWSTDGSGSESVFELTPEGADTRLVITQRRVATPEILLNMTAGWHAHVGLLVDILTDTPRRAFQAEHARLLENLQDRFAE